MPNHKLIRGEQKRWRIAAPDARADDLARRLRIGQLTAQVLCRRGIHEAAAARAFVSPTLNQLHDPRRLPGAERAAQRLVQAVRTQQRIVIYGDYDVDGITASAILYHVIKAADPAADVHCYVPHRLEEGYGLNREAIATLAGEGAELIVSVDCGITATGPADTARERGVDLVITDHHELGDDLPAAHTLVHPRLPAGANPGDPAEPYPFGELCGAGVAYKLAWQFARAWCGSEQVGPVFRQMLVDLLPLAALGTIADVVPLVDENRALAVFGLRHIQDTPWPGLNALIGAAALREQAVNCYHVGFVLGPRLNACGRMGHARQAIQLLTDVGAEEAAEIATFLNAENEDRRATERQIVQEAAEMVMSRGDDGDDVRAIVLGHEDWHPGVVGIVCSRLVERFGRPTILLNTAGDTAQGSARSIDAFNMHQALASCRRHLTSFGGHAMAAGLKLPVAGIEAFRQDLVACANAQLKPADLVPLLEVDAVARSGSLRAEVVDELERLAPFGRSNPAPRICLPGAQLACDARTMGREGRHLNFDIRHGSRGIRCVAWNLGHWAPRLAAGREVDLVGRPKLNHFRGKTTVELEVHDLRLEPAEVVTLPQAVGRVGVRNGSETQRGVTS